jgi:hypothetical protein
VVDSLPGHAVKALGNVRPLQLQLDGFPRFDRNRLPAHPKTVGRELIAEAANAKPDFPPHQGWVGDRGQSSAIGIERRAGGGPEFDQRHAPIRRLVHHLDHKRLGRLRNGDEGGGDDQEREKADGFHAISLMRRNLKMLVDVRFAGALVQPKPIIAVGKQGIALAVAPCAARSVNGGQRVGRREEMIDRPQTDGVLEPRR